MSDTVKLIIEIPRYEYEYTCERTLSDRTFWDDAIRKGTPLDVKIANMRMKKEEILHHFQDINFYYNDCMMYDDLSRMLDELIAEIKDEWIPVSERLPDNNVRVLCSAISTSISGGCTRFVGCCNNGFWFVQTDAETVSYPGQYKVTAWMPLPEPYKAEKPETCKGCLEPCIMYEPDMRACKKKVKSESEEE